MSERISQDFALVSCIDPFGVAASGTSTGDVIDASLYDKLLFVLSVGSITSSGAVTLTVYKGTSATAASITSSVTAVSVTEKGDNTQKLVDVDVSKEGNYRYYKPTLVANGGTTTGACFAAVHVFASGPRYHPGSDNDLTSATITLA